MHECRQCGGEVAARHRFCSWCGTLQRLKIVQFFAPHQGIAGDRGKLLRASHYVGLPDDQRHVRFSVWNEEGVAEAAVSLDPGESRRLADFIRDPCGSPPSRLGSIVAQLRADVDLAFGRHPARPTPFREDRESAG